MNKEIIELKTEQQNTSNTEWYAVTIQREETGFPVGCIPWGYFVKGDKFYKLLANPTSSKSARFQ